VLVHVAPFKHGLFTLHSSTSENNTNQVMQSIRYRATQLCIGFNHLIYFTGSILVYMNKIHGLKYY